MKEMDMSRRNFLKGAVIAAAGAVAPMVLAGCGNARQHLSKEAQKETAGGSGPAAEPDFLRAPATIEGSKISSTGDTDIVVVGAGMSGLSAAVAAAQQGAKVTLIEKTQNVNFRSYDYGAVNAKVQQETGTKIDEEFLTTELMRYGSYRPDQKVVQVFTKQSGLVNDWLMGLA